MTGHGAVWLSGFQTLIYPLTVLGHLQDVAYEWAVSVEGLRPGQVNAPLLGGTQGGHWVFWRVRKLPARQSGKERIRKKTDGDGACVLSRGRERERKGGRGKVRDEI